jgi:hypothetical protein
MTDKLLREAAQNILNGIETGAIKIETDQDESWANALSALRSALAQSESEPDKLEKAARAIYDMMPFDGVGSEKKPAWVEGGNSLKQDEARRYARAALAEAQQGDGLGLKMVDGWGVFDTLENGEPFLETLGSRFFVFESRTAADDKQHRWPWGTATVRPVQVVWRECQYPDCLDGYLQEFSAEGLRVKGNPCPTCHGEKP